jgi:hypothetical protein
MGLPRPAVPDEHSFSSRLRSPTVSARLGVAVGICFGTAFLTGLLSHYAQLPHQPVPFPVNPVWGYRVTQGLHVISGTAAIPLLLVKLWSVFPKLFARPPRRIGLLLVEAAERVSIAVLVGAAITELATGVANVAQWYAWDFNFRRSHFALAWIAIGAMVVHIAVKLPVIRAALGVDPDADDAPDAAVTGLTRRGLLRVAWAGSAVAVLATGFGTIRGLGRASVLAARSRDEAEGLPVNRSAVDAGVTATATSSAYRLVVSRGSREVALSREQLLALPQHTQVLPIACVEGWSVDGRWTGPRIRDLLDLVDAPSGSDIVVRSLQQHGPDRVTTLPGNFAGDERTLLALALNDEPLALDHGFPARVIAPNRPGALQTKWVAALEVAT